ncbi:MAG: histidine kinase [Lewinella sp.]|nr:histidine kinase [Lewinella sp.]
MIHALRAALPFPYATGLLFLLLFCYISSGCDRRPAFHPTTSQSLSLPELEVLSHTDSIIQRIETMSGTQQKLDTLLSLTNEMKDFDVDAALRYANEAYKLSTLKARDLYKGISLYYISLLKSRKRTYGEESKNALEDAHMSNRIFKRLEEKAWQARVYNLIGIIFYRKEKADSARHYQHLALDLLDQAHLDKKDSLSFAGEILHDLGNTYYKQKDTTQIFTYYRESLSNYQQSGNLPALAKLQSDMGNVFRDVGNFEKAISLYQQSLAFIKKNQDRNMLATVWDNLGKLYKKRYISQKNESDVILALAAFDSTLAYQRENFYIPLERIGVTYHTYAYFTDDETLLDSALYYYGQTMSQAGKEGAILIMQNMVNQITLICNAMAEDRAPKNNYCTQLFQTSPEDFLIQGYQSVIDTVTATLEETSQQLVQFEREEVEVEAFRQRRNQLLISAFILLLAVLVFLILLQGQQQKRLKARMEALRAQINPHFISNSLNAIENLVNHNQPEAASRYLIHFSRLSRRILNGSIDSTISLADELKTLEHFLALEQLRFRDKLEYEIQVDPDLNPNIVEVPAMILQPYAENAILHGIKPKPEPGHLKVSVKQEGKFVICIIEDDGVGREKARQIKANSVLKNRSVGMKITEERLRSIGKNKNAKVEIIDLYDQAGEAAGTRVVLKFPIQIKKTISNGQMPVSGV